MDILNFDTWYCVAEFLPDDSLFNLRLSCEYLRDVVNVYFIAHPIKILRDRVVGMSSHDKSITDANFKHIEKMCSMKKTRYQVITWLCNYGQFSSFKRLFKKWRNSTKYHIHDVMILFRQACMNGNSKVVKWLLDSKKSKITITKSNVVAYENCAFRLACYHGHLDVVKTLITHTTGPRLTIRDITCLGSWAIRLACENNHFHIVKWIHTHFRDDYEDYLRRSDKDIFRYACKHGDESVLKWFAKYKHKNWSAKHIRFLNADSFRGAFVNKHTDIVKWLLDADVITYSHVRSLNNQIIQLGCMSGYVEGLTLLSDKFTIPIDDVRSDNNYAFRVACSHGNMDVIYWLLSNFHLTDEDFTSKNNWAFKEACGNGHVEVIEWIHDVIHHKINDKVVIEAFTKACENGHLDIIRWLTINYGLDISKLLSMNPKIIQWAIVNSHVHVVEWLNSF